MSGNPLGTVDRVIEILRAVAEAEGDITIKDISTTLDLPPSTVHRMFDLFVRQGLLEADHEHHRYRAGLELYRISALVTDRMDVATLAGEEMAAVVAGCGETCALARYVPAELKITYVARVESRHPLQVQIETFRPQSILWGAAVRSILAHLAPLDVEEALKARDPAPATGAPPPDRAALFTRIAEIREAGYARSAGDDIGGVHAIAAPIFGIGGRVTGSLSVVIPELRHDPAKTDGIATLVMDQATIISQRIGDTLADPQARRFRAWALGR
jgi:DNA-binding IclR family transcriptional regulator